MKSEFYLNEKEISPIEEIPVNGGLTSILENVVVIGDSLAAGEIHTKSESEEYWTDVLEGSWPAFLASDSNINVKNFSRGGMTAKEFMETYGKEKDYFNKENLKDIKAYIIALGVNDFINMHQTKEEYIKYMRKLLDAYKEISPNARFFLMTMPTELTDPDNNIEWKRIQKEAIYEISNEYTYTYVMDMNKYLVYTKEYKDKYWHIDHHNVLGYRLCAFYIEAYIDYIIRHNIKDFALFSLLNTKYYL